MRKGGISDVRATRASASETVFKPESRGIAVKTKACFSVVTCNGISPSDAAERSEIATLV